ncbi:MAG: glycosyltransferase family 1 protein, partial [Pseudomonadota bacterium]
YFHQTPVGTGIQRVVSETVGAIVNGDTELADVEIVYFDKTGIWKIIPKPALRKLLAKASKAGDDWKTKYPKMVRSWAKGETAKFKNSDTLYYLGAPTSNHGMIEALLTMENERPRCVYYVHDVIPIKFPELFKEEHVSAFTTWLFQLNTVAQGIICNSEATRRDFLEVTGYAGPSSTVNLAIAPPILASEPKASRVEILSELKLMDAPFVLMVGTVEPRKNHVIAFRVWQALQRRLGDDCPVLVVVGALGWNTQNILADFDAVNSAGRIVLAGAQNDETLTVLYHHCQFTVYLSNYEGWGLPITESLAFGKACVCGNNSSLPEAAQGLAFLVNHKDQTEIEEQIATLVENPDLLSAQEAKIIRERTFKSWTDFYLELRTIESELPQDGKQAVAAVTPNVTYTFGHEERTGPHGQRVSGASFRVGKGWYAAEDWGCWSSSKSSRIQCKFQEAGQYEVYLHIKVPGAGAHLTLAGPNGVIWEGFVQKSRVLSGTLDVLSANEAVELSIVTTSVSPYPSRKRAQRDWNLSVGWIALHCAKGPIRKSTSTVLKDMLRTA